MRKLISAMAVTSMALCMTACQTQVQSNNSGMVATENNESITVEHEQKDTEKDSSRTEENLKSNEDNVYMQRADNAEVSEALAGAFKSHDSFKDDVKSFNTKIVERDYSQQEIDNFKSMNKHFLKALVDEALSSDYNYYSDAGNLSLRKFKEEVLERRHLIDEDAFVEYAGAVIINVDYDYRILLYQNLMKDVDTETYQSIVGKTPWEESPEEEASEYPIQSLAKGINNRSLVGASAAVTNDVSLFSVDSVSEAFEYPVEEFNTKEYNTIDENVFKSVKTSPLSTFSIDVDTASYTDLKYTIRNGWEIEKDAVKIEELINYFNYDYSSERVGDEPFSVDTEYTVCPWNTEHKLMRIGIKADEVNTDLKTNFVLVVDVSGSMLSILKLPLALSAYADMVENLNEEDKISLMYYANGTDVLLDSIPCSESDKIYHALAKAYLGAGGGTNGSLGLNTAYEMAEKNLIKDGVNRVIIATDGDFNIGKTSEGELKDIVEKGRKKGVYLTILGYGDENLKDNKMEVMAENGNGNYHYIGDVSDATKALVEEAQCTLIPVADDVKIQVEFNPSEVAEYRLIGYESRLLNAEDFNNDKVDAGEVGAGKSVTALYEIVPVGSVSETSTPDLKYTQNQALGESTDVCTVSIRYKDVNSSLFDYKSHLAEYVVPKETFVEIPSDNTSLAIALAEYGMVIRDSEFKGSATLSSAQAIAEAVYKDTNNPYVGEFVELIKMLKEQSE